MTFHMDPVRLERYGQGADDDAKRRPDALCRTPGRRDAKEDECLTGAVGGILQNLTTFHLFSTYFQHLSSFIAY